MRREAPPSQDENEAARLLISFSESPWCHDATEAEQLQGEGSGGATSETGKRRSSSKNITEAEAEVEIITKSLDEAKNRESEIALALIETQERNTDLLRRIYEGGNKDAELSSNLDQVLIESQNQTKALCQARLAVKIQSSALTKAQLLVKTLSLVQEAKKAKITASPPPIEELKERRCQIRQASRLRAQTYSLLAGEEKGRDKERAEIFEKINLALIEKPNLKKFLEENGVYKNLESWLKNMTTTKCRNKIEDKTDSIEASDEDVKNALIQFYEKKTVTEDKIQIFSNILKFGYDAINEILDSENCSIKMEFLKEMLNKVQTHYKIIEIGDSKIKPSTICRYFIDSDIKLEANQLIIEKVIKGKRSDLLDKYIKDDPDFFREQMDSGSSDFLHRAIKIDVARMVFSFLLLGFDPNAENSQGDRPLHSFSNSKTLGAIFIITQMLLSYGADPSIKNSKGELPADILVKSQKQHLQETINLMTGVANFICQQKDLPSSSSQISSAIQNEGGSGGRERIEAPFSSSPAGSELKRAPSPILNIIFSGCEPDPLSPAGASRSQDGSGPR